MARKKRSLAAERQKWSEALGKVFGGVQYPSIEEYVALLRENLPTENPVAALYRRYASLRDALNAWVIQDIENPLGFLDPGVRRAYREGVRLFGEELPPIVKRYIHEPERNPPWARKWRRAVADKIGSVLERGDSYSVVLAAARALRAAESVREEWGNDPRVLATNEVRKIVEPLIAAYLNPSEFFWRTVEEIDPGAFADHFLPLSAETCERIREGTRTGEVVGEPDEIIGEYPLRMLLNAVWTWGVGVLLYRTDARAAFDALSGERQAQILSVVERRKPYADGAPKGRGLSESDVVETVEMARNYVSDLTPAERSEDQTIYEPTEQKRIAGRSRKPTGEEAARARAAKDLEVSTRTLRRVLSGSGKKKLR